MSAKRNVKRALAFMGIYNKFINIDNPATLKVIGSKNNALLYHIYFKRMQKQEAIDTLKKKTRFKLQVSHIEQCVYAYLYFNDIDGALAHISQYKDKIPSIVALECLIRIHMQLLKNRKDCSDNTVFSYVIKGLLSHFDRRLVSILRDFYEINCDGCFKECLKMRFLQIEDIIMKNHYDTLTYKNAKFLYKMMPHKLPFLKKMVECNPFIKKEYYFKYANVYGVNKDDILRILRVKYRPWALEIAMMYGWIDESLRTTLEKDLWGIPLLINEKYGKDVDLDEIMAFSRKKLYDPDAKKDDVV